MSSDQQKALRLGPEGSCKQAGSRTQGLSSQRGANLVGDGLERSRVGARDIGQDLAVHVDASHVQAVDKLRVGEAFQARRAGLIGFGDFPDLLKRALRRKLEGFLLTSGLR